MTLKVKFNQFNSGIDFCGQSAGHYGETVILIYIIVTHNTQNAEYILYTINKYETFWMLYINKIHKNFSFEAF